MEEGGSDIVQMSKQSEEAAPQLVVPNLPQKKQRIIIIPNNNHLLNLKGKLLFLNTVITCTIHVIQYTLKI